MWLLWISGNGNGDEDDGYHYHERAVLPLCFAHLVFLHSSIEHESYIVDKFTPVILAHILLHSKSSEVAGLVPKPFLDRLEERALHDALMTSVPKVSCCMITCISSYG